MAQLEASSKKVEEWLRKSCEVYNYTRDGIISLSTRVFESMEFLISPTPDRNTIQRALRTVDSERKVALEFEKSNVDPVRMVTYGIIESFQLTILHLTDKIDSLQAQIDINLPKSLPNVEKYCQTDEIPLGFNIDEMQIKMEEIMNENLEHPMHRENVHDVADYPHSVANSVDGLSTVPHFTLPISKEIKEEKVEPKDESIDTGVKVKVAESSGLDILGGDMDCIEGDTMNEDVVDQMEDMVGESDAISDDLIEKEGEKKESIDNVSDAMKDSFETVEMDKRRKASRNVSNNVKYKGTMDDFDEDSQPAVKKSKSDSEKIKKDKREDQSASADKDRRSYKQNSTDLECPECEFRSRNVSSWINHLRIKHSTNLYLAGLALLCDCSHESISKQHASECTVANSTVIRKRDGPIRRLTDEKTTPQCVKCDFYPKTPRGYIDHLTKHHSSTLSANGIYLACSCGLDVRTQKDYAHAKECDKRQFTLHRLDQE